MQLLLLKPEMKSPLIKERLNKCVKANCTLSGVVFKMLEGTVLCSCQNYFLIKCCSLIFISNKVVG